jgi:creatinine amidohydrolase
VEHLLTTSTTNDVGSAGARVAVLPVGSCEQHGEYLPLITDTVVACVIAHEIATAYNLWLLPPVTFSCSHEHAAWPGTVSISAATLHQVITDIAASARQNGADKLVIVNGHGGNYALSNIVQEANAAERHMVLFPVREDWAAARTAAGMQTTNHEDMHAGELEVSILLHAYPDLVRSGIDAADHEASNRPHLLVLGMQGYTETGIIGRPSLGSADKGKGALEHLTQSFTKHLELLGTS